MDKYYHYGVEVIRQISNTPFRKRLKSIEYMELPFLALDYTVITYIENDERKFVVIVPLCVPDNYAELNYATNEIPLDCNWANLISDIERQRRGEEPMKMQSRFGMALQESVAESRESLSEKVDIFAETQQTPEMDYEEIRLRLMKYGYDLSTKYIKEKLGDKILYIIRN